MPVRRPQIRRMVEEILRQHKVSGPPVPLRAIAKSLNASIVQTPAEEGLSGFLLRKKDGSATIGVNSDQHPVRRNFTVAHEIGHLLLHASEPLHIDKERVVFLRSPASSDGVDLNEVEANQFAAELLMPMMFIQRDVEAHGGIDFMDDGLLKKLATRYGVSVQAMSIRLATCYNWQITT